MSTVVYDVTDVDLAGDPVFDTEDVIVGPQGPVGPPGLSGFEFVQTVPMGTWTIPHTLNRHPQVQVYVADEQVDTDVHATTTQVVLTFALPTVGVAVVS